MVNINLDDDFKPSHRRVPEKNKTSLSHTGRIHCEYAFLGNTRGIDYLLAKEILKQATEEIAELNERSQARSEERKRTYVARAKQRKLENQKQ